MLVLRYNGCLESPAAQHSLLAMLEIYRPLAILMFQTNNKLRSKVQEADRKRRSEDASPNRDFNLFLHFNR